MPKILSRKFANSCTQSIYGLGHDGLCKTIYNGYDGTGNDCVLIEFSVKSI